MTEGNNPVPDRGKMGTKRHILTDKKSIPLAVCHISSANTHVIKLVTGVVDSAVIKRSSSSKPPSRRKGRRRRLQHLCLDKAFNSTQEEQVLIKRGYVLHISPKRKRGEEEEVQVTNHGFVSSRFNNFVWIEY